MPQALCVPHHTFHQGTASSDKEMAKERTSLAVEYLFGGRSALIFNPPRKEDMPLISGNRKCFKWYI